jgi:uncharacterized oligopeptide transporter (OPT) family protein
MTDVNLESGNLDEVIEEAKNEIYLNDLKNIHLNLAQRKIKMTKTRVVNMIGSYCANKIRSNNQKIQVMKKTGRKVLMFSLAISAALLGIGIGLSILFPHVSTAIAGLLTIVIWVIVWWPVELLVFDWREFAIDNKSYRVLAQITEDNIEIN